MVAADFRRFATVERRAQLLAGDNYHSIPSDVDLAISISSVSPECGDGQVSYRSNSCARSS